ncbi:hypothetical protein Caci_1949 [Catenulispora acidiphila DSM 44928]|uniref:Uncharacterized protein n=1 Tax=Catenulispora acidiphila (strain DSM 44928 / JCM 14897 / NBRC 102108 / NRRL B-24433 / ID139908) TaxID=479433 RepID=C7QEH8_CATAD|nr:hypothetical protein Caci_1949 [Catenulispora acidiphila DSM 44928]
MRALGRRSVMADRSGAPPILEPGRRLVLVPVLVLAGRAIAKLRLHPAAPERICQLNSPLAAPRLPHHPTPPTPPHNLPPRSRPTPTAASASPPIVSVSSAPLPWP